MVDGWMGSSVFELDVTSDLLLAGLGHLISC